jgi:hypothetical protein
MTAVYTYKKNMDAVRRFFPGMERKIAEAPAAALAVETAASGEPTARLGGLYLHSASSLLHFQFFMHIYAEISILCQ